jgi:DNA-binding transcriptional MocR family regulator
LSYKISESSWLQKTGSPLAKLVLIALSEFANDKGFCWPSVRTLAIRCEVSERTIQRELRKLEANGQLKTKISTGRTSNRYTITPTISQGSNGQPLPIDGDTLTISRGKPRPLVTSTLTNSHPIRSGNQSLEPVKEGEAAPKLSESQKIRLEEEAKRLRRRIAEIRKMDFKGNDEISELRSAKHRVAKIDAAIHIPL